MSATNDQIIKRIDVMEQRMEGLGKTASDFRDTVNRELAEIKTQMALGGQSQSAMNTKLDKIATHVDTLLSTQRREEGAINTWNKVIDPVLKVAVALMVAYLVFYLKIK